MTPTPTRFRIPMARPAYLGREVEYVTAAVTRKDLSQGWWVRNFEEAFAQKLGVSHAVAVSSGTAALHLALLAAGVKPGDRVLVPTLTYVASVAAVRYCGAVPVFADADPETWGLRDVQADVTQTLPVHLYGVPSMPDEELFHTVEDAAEALGASAHGHACGTLGRLGTFSFYANKILTTGEGGMVVTDDAALADEVRLLRGQGQSPTRRYWHTRVGYNYRMTDLQAALGLAQLEQLDAHLERRTARWNRYAQNLAGSGVTWQSTRPGTQRAPWVFAGLLPALGPRELTTPMYPTFRDTVMAELAKAGIETRPTFPCVHTMPPYLEFALRQDAHYDARTGRAEFPTAEDISRRGLLLPLHAEMPLADVDEVCATLLRLL